MPLFLLPFLAGAKFIFTAIITFCSKPPGSWIACAVAALLALWWFGQHEVNKGRSLQVAAEAAAAKPIIAKQNQITHDVVTKFITVKADDAAKTIIRIKEVPIYVTAKADAACPVTLGFVRLFNDATHGPVPPAGAGTNDEPSGVALSEVAQASVENNGQYDIIAHQLTALQDWVQQQQKANPK